LLWPLSLIYRTLFTGRRLLYRLGWLTTQRFKVPVVVVGNVVVGGAGKTPVVMALVQHLRQRGLRVGVISRGYGRRSRGCMEVLPDSRPGDVGDEPVLIRRSTGVPSATTCPASAMRFRCWSPTPTCGPRSAA
jgi:tetraacyldisaccharide 4'-kinase